MDFKVEHRFDAVSIDDYADLHFDEAFNRAMCADVGFARTLIKKYVADGKLHTEATIQPDKAIPAPVAKILGVDRMTHREVIEYDIGSYEGTWRIEPGMFADTFIIGGGFRFEALSDSSVSRVYWGDFQVKLRGVGGWMEKMIVSEVQRSYDSAVGFIQDYIKAVNSGSYPKQNSIHVAL